MPAPHEPHVRRNPLEKLIASEKKQMAIDCGGLEPAEAETEEGDGPTGGQARELLLEHGEHRDATVFRFNKGDVVRFRPGASLLGRKVFLFTNCVPPDAGDDAEFVRARYRGLEWRAIDKAGRAEPLGAALLVDDRHVVAELPLCRAGSFHYYFVYDTADCRLGPQGSGWVQAAPRLPCGVPLDGVMCQTVLAKCLGPLPRWPAVLRLAHLAHYNMIHFTPLQELGESGSSYSLAEQLRLDPRLAAPGQPPPTFADVETFVAKMHADWNMLAISDVVLNHTANETAWLAEHPEAAYNCRDCAHLRPAALLDCVLARLTADVSRGAVPGVPPQVTTEDHIQAVRVELCGRLSGARLHEFAQCDEDALVALFRAAAANKVGGVAGEGGGGGGEGALRLRADPLRRRRAATVDMHAALRLYHTLPADVSAAADRFRRALRALNQDAEAEMAEHLRAAVDNCVAGMRYERLAADGPRLAEVSARRPLVARYFTLPTDVERAELGALETALWGAAGARVMAHNGWVMAADPLADFAAAEAAGRVYLRRELIAWGDSVKLRYGARPEDSPFLWRHMRRYVELTAEVFDGIRLDNCHSTPLHVAEYLLDCARNVKPELYVVAELFTNSDCVDNIFVNRLGITSLIREAQSAWDAREQGRLVHRFGGRAVGAFLPPGAPRAPRAARPAVAHAVLMDLTHDNPSPVAKRSVYDLLPTAALVAMACCATGSTRGYDDLVPHHVHVVEEARLYAGVGAADGGASPDGGLLPARAHLNRLHAELAAAGYSEIYVDQMDDEVVAVTRHHPLTRKSVITVAVTAFGGATARAPRAPRPLRFEGELEEIALEARLVRAAEEPYEPHPQYINGLPGYRCEARAAVPLAESRTFAGLTRDGAEAVLEFRPLPPGAVAVVRARPLATAAAALQRLHDTLRALRRGEDAFAVRRPLAELDLADLNAVLYRCDAEERDAGGPGAYDVPGHGPLAYAGLQGVVSLLEGVAAADDLGHAVCANLRAGDWLADYTWQRLEREPRLRAVAERWRAALSPLGALPRFLQPAYFEAVVSALHAEAERAALRRLAPWCGAGRLARLLALASVQLAGRVPSAPLPPLAAPPPLPPPSLSAGLPHFAVGYMRCWGRDTFISLRGLFLLTGRYEDARAHILGFAACLRHGLIPNLLDGGPRARFNCRDAVWWWLDAVRRYCEEAPGGPALLDEPVLRLFPRDDAEPGAAAAPQPLADVVQEALEAHFQGRAFRERNAGRALDAHMTDRGFDVQIGVHPETGFPFGGNDANCGTWMDKMGSSERAGNRGRPATPRDGSAVELVALCYGALRWLERAHRGGRYAHAAVRRPDAAWTWRQWADRIERSFERHFWVPEAPSAADARPDLVHRRAIYKDSHGASQPWADYQLRCNYAVAMAVAPELFDARHAWLALDQVEKHLLGSLGVKTLDPADWAYRPDYDNSDDSTDANVAHGFNYHQGPEWTWPLGFYLRARLAFAHQSGQHARTVAAVLRALGPLLQHAQQSPWRGLPELTNAGGRECAGSCRTQAWSAAAVLEALHELSRARRATALD